MTTTEFKNYYWIVNSEELSEYMASSKTLAPKLKDLPLDVKSCKFRLVVRDISHVPAVMVERGDQYRVDVWTWAMDEPSAHVTVLFVTESELIDLESLAP
jgi:hypothetical protein